MRKASASRESEAHGARQPERALRQFAAPRRVGPASRVSAQRVLGPAPMSRPCARAASRRLVRPPAPSIGERLDGVTALRPGPGPGDSSQGRSRTDVSRRDAVEPTLAQGGRAVAQSPLRRWSQRATSWTFREYGRGRLDHAAASAIRIGRSANRPCCGKLCEQREVRESSIADSGPGQAGRPEALGLEVAREAVDVAERVDGPRVLAPEDVRLLEMR